MSNPTLATATAQTSNNSLDPHQLPPFTICSKVASSQLFPARQEDADYRRTDEEFQILDYTAVMKESNLSIYPPLRKEIEDFPVFHELKITCLKRLTKIALWYPNLGS